MSLIDTVLGSSFELAFIEASLDGTILQWNAGATRLYGFERGEVVGRPIVPILGTPMDAEVAGHDGVVEASLRHGQWEGDVDARQKNGDRFIAHVLVTPRWNSTGRPISVAIIARNTSDELPHLEKVLRQIRERLALTLEAEQIAHFASWQWDLKKDVAQWSEEMYALFDREPSFVPSLETSLQALHPEDRGPVDAAVKKAIEEHGVYDMEYRIVRRDESIRVLHAFGRAHYDADGTPTRMVGAVYDITETRRAQADLARSERRFRTLFETAVEPILLVDESAAIIGANPAMEKVTGLPRARLLKEGLDTFLWPQDRERTRTYIRDLLAGRPVKEPFELSIAGARARHVLEVHGRPIHEGSPPYVQLVARDVTERREMTRRLMESERQASIGQVASFVAHEVNNPLANIALLTASLRKMAKDPASQAKLDKIDQQRKIAGRTINELLDLTRARQLNAASVDLRSVVEAAVEQVVALRRAGVALEVDLDPEPMRAFVDSTRMAQAIGNLVKNAFQATESGTVRVHLERRSSDYAIIISDSGPGIAPDVREKLFRTFFTTKPRGEGTGLGLPFTLFVVAAHQGRIEVDSEPGHGATFTVLLPFEAAGTPEERDRPES